MATCESYDRLEKKEISVHVLVQWHFKRIVETIGRRLTFHQKYKNPWTIELVEPIQCDIFRKAFQAVRDHSPSVGLTYTVKRDRQGNGLNYRLNFTWTGTLRYHLHKLSGFSKKEIDNFFMKKSETKGKAFVKLSEDQPCIVEYDVKKSTLKLNLQYHVENTYGNVISI